jgi:hypothetical protein
MVLVRGQLDPANGAVFKAAIEAYSAPTSREPSDAKVDQLPVPDDRSRRQRQADAAGVIGRIVLRQAGRGRAEADRPKVVVHLPAAEVEQTGPLSLAWIARLACDSLVEAVDVEGLQLGRAVRTATPAQRRFLIARDRYCVIPGCATPAAWGDAHHVQWWSHAGGTDVTNMAMVCGRHHTDIHAGIWSLTMIDGEPWAIHPAGSIPTSTRSATATATTTTPPNNSHSTSIPTTTNPTTRSPPASQPVRLRSQVVPGGGTTK